MEMYQSIFQNRSLVFVSVSAIKEPGAIEVHAQPFERLNLLMAAICSS